MPLISGGYAEKSPAWLLNGVPAPTSAFRESLSRIDCVTDCAALTTAVMTSVAIPVQPGDVITKIAFCSGATAADTPLNWWFALYDDSSTPALLAQTADQTTTAWAADTVKDVSLASTVTVTKAAVYYAAVMVKATTPPTLVGRTLARANAASALVTGQKVLARTSGSALTTTAPATIASPTTVATVPWCLVH